METKELIALMNCQEKESLMKTLEIEFVDKTDEFLIARMPVTPKVHQHDNILHGGATFALAETVGSAGAYLFGNPETTFIRGLEMSGNHIKSVSKGYIYAKAKIIHKGRTTQVWDIKVTTEKDELISIFKLTTITLPKK